MKLFKKLAINVHSHVESMADRFENKEALSSAYLREYERIAAKAKVRLSQVDSEVARLEKEAGRLHEQAALWAERARRVHANDESKALDCVARMTRAQSGYRQVQSDLQEAGRLKQKMSGDMDRILKKMASLKRRHQNLAGRQACAEAFHALQDADGGMQDDIDDLFARWETDVVARELHTRSSGPEEDPLAEEFDAAEQKQALRLALEQIIATPGTKEEKKPC